MRLPYLKAVIPAEGPLRGSGHCFSICGTGFCGARQNSLQKEGP